jgi:hypothetical protein
MPTFRSTQRASLFVEQHRLVLGADERLRIKLNVPIRVRKWGWGPNLSAIPISAVTPCMGLSHRLSSLSALPG